MPLPRAPVLPGEEVTFTIEATAPVQTGTWPFQWRLNQGAVGWFGDPTPAVMVQVQ